MPDQPHELIRDLIHRISTWLEINKENQKAVKPLTEILEVLRWAQESINTMPPEVKTSFQAGILYANMAGVQTALEMYLPPVHPVNVSGITSIGSSTSSITSAALLLNPGGLTRSDITGSSWLLERSEAYKKLQERQEKSRRVRELLGALQTRVPSDPNLIAEFDYMMEKTAQGKVSSGEDDVSAGIAMRNLLDHYKGKIYEAARKAPDENMTWAKMVERLTTFSPGTIGYTTLLGEEATWSNLKSELSDVAKNRAHGPIDVLNVLLLTHLFTVLSLVTLYRRPYERESIRLSR